MKSPVSLSLTPGAVLVLLGVTVGGYLVYKAAGAASDLAGKAADAVGDAAWAITPWNNENAIYQGVNGWLFDDENTTIGTALYDLFNPDPATEQQVVKATNQTTATFDWAASTPTATSNPTFTITPYTGGASGGW